MPDTKSHERPLLHCLSRTAAGFLTVVPVATLVTGLCLLCLWGLGFLLVILFRGPIYSLFVGTYCAKTVRNSGDVWQMLLIAAAGGVASWYLLGSVTGSIHWYGGFWLLFATTVCWSLGGSDCVKCCGWRLALTTPSISRYSTARNMLRLRCESFDGSYC